MIYADIFAYRGALRSELARNGFPSEVHKVKLLGVTDKKAVRGMIRAYAIAFEDGAQLDVEESVSVVDGAVFRDKYKYHYEKGDFFFRYDKDVAASQSRTYQHAPCHLHVSGAGHEQARYITHETNFEAVLRFIMATFYGRP